MGGFILRDFPLLVKLMFYFSLVEQLEVISKTKKTIIRSCKKNSSHMESEVKHKY